MSKRILFVCTGNTCRSPLAEGLLREMAKRAGFPLEVQSAGIAAAEGGPVSRHSSDILKEKGAFTAGSSSRMLTRRMVDDSELILTMTMSHKRAVIQRFPEAVDRVFTLKEYAVTDAAVLQLVQEREQLVSELEMKLALGQTVTREEKERLFRLELELPDSDIADPFGGGRQDYELAAEEIEECLSRVLQKLQSSD